MALPYRVEWPLRVSQEFGGAPEISASAVRLFAQILGRIDRLAGHPS